MFEFVNDTPVKALTWHTAPYTGSVDCIVPKGTRAWLGARMNPAYHYFNPVEGSYTNAWMESIVSKAREESPIPQRFNGGLSFFLSIKALLGDQVKFLPSNFKKKEGYKRSIELSAMYDLYRQDFCGCSFSKAERELQKNC